MEDRMETKLKKTYGYNEADFKKFTKYAWLMLLSFGFLYMFFHNSIVDITG